MWQAMCAIIVAALAGLAAQQAAMELQDLIDSEAMGGLTEAVGATQPYIRETDRAVAPAQSA